MTQLTITTDQLDQLENQMDLDVAEEVRTDYSGRGMYGRTCLGYTGGAAMEFIANVALLLLSPDDDDPWDLVQQLAEIGEGRQDSMGIGRIVYWPSIAVETSPAS